MAVQKEVPVAPAEVVSTNPAPANTPAQARLAKENAAVSTNASPKADTSKTDSVGKPKEQGNPAPVGPRGPSRPRDSVPAPPLGGKKADQTKVTATDTKDNAGNDKVGQGTEHHIGIRGTHTSRDTYAIPSK
jgi:hypothetical protein